MENVGDGAMLMNDNEAMRLSPHVEKEFTLTATATRQLKRETLFLDKLPAEKKRKKKQPTQSPLRDKCSNESYTKHTHTYGS